MSVLIVGAGYMAKEYAKVLSAMNEPFIVVGRGEKKINELKENYPGAICFAGGLDNYLESNPAPAKAIVATNVESLYLNTKALLEKGIRSILVEKPVALYMHELKELQKLSIEKKSIVNIAYNRRFYQSVQHAGNMIEKDGGILSAHFEFTEWVHLIDPSIYDPETLKKWGISNSSHVIDLVFSMIGLPAELHAYVNNKSISWHPSGAIFTGAGMSEKNIPFTYHSNWKSAGRWSIDLLTAEHKLIFAPMEKLQVQKRGTVTIETFDADYSLDTQFKPGLHEMLHAFNSNDTAIMCSLEEHIRNFHFYDLMAGYSN